MLLSHERRISFRVQIQPIDPIYNLVFCSRDTVSGNRKPIRNNRCVRLQFRNRLNGSGKSASAVGSKRNNGFSAEIIFLKECVERHWQISVPVRILKCSPSSPALENTGLNGLHKCVFCSFLVAYCSDLSHLLYSGLPVYTNTYV